MQTQIIVVVALLSGVFAAPGFAQSTQPGTAAAGKGMEPTYADVKYGPHERQVMDVWLAQSDEPTPVLVAIHGGGFQLGTKNIGPGLRKLCLDGKISVIAIDYRLSKHAIAPAAFHDGARAIQFVRHNAPKWNIDPRRIAATGGSAGAGIALWVAFHTDLADPQSEDPVLRESTRLTCVATTVGQCSYDPRFIRTLIPENDVYKSQFLAALFGTRLDDLENLPPEKYKLFEEVSAINHLTKAAPPVLQIYSHGLDAPVTDPSVGIHHARFGKALKDKMDALGIPCELVTTLRGNEPVILAFVKKHFAME